MARKVLLVALFSLCVSYLADAQSFYNIRRPRDLMLNFGSGIAYYKGDLINPGEIMFIKPNITIGAEYYFNPRMSVRPQLTWFQTEGNDAKADDDRDERHLSFKSGNIEFAITGTLNLLKTPRRYYERRTFNIHGFTGIGLLYFNPKTYMDGEKYVLRKYKTEGVAYSRIQPVIPVGLGARIYVNPYFNILIEGGYRFTFTDYLDDVSRKRYLGPEAFDSDIAYRLSDRRPEIDTQPSRPTEVGVRGNPDNNDGYFIMNISVQYYWPHQLFKLSQRKLYTVKRKSIYRKPRRR
jgi:hypothetical protein